MIPDPYTLERSRPPRLPRVHPPGAVVTGRRLVLRRALIDQLGIETGDYLEIFVGADGMSATLEPDPSCRGSRASSCGRRNKDGLTDQLRIETKQLEHMADGRYLSTQTDTGVALAPDPDGPPLRIKRAKKKKRWRRVGIRPIPKKLKPYGKGTSRSHRKRRHPRKKKENP